MAANGHIIDFRRGASAAAVEPIRDRVECDWSAASDPGCGGHHNEDAWRALPEAGVFMVADGLGGYNAGDVAAQLALERLTSGLVGDVDAFDRPAVLSREIALANASILTAAARRPECLGMATTLAGVWVDEHRLLAAHVGNSRIYLLRGKRFSRLTRDHVLPENGALTRVLGAEPIVDADLCETDWFHGDRLLICTDGLHQSVGEATLADCLQGADRAAACVDGLLAAALAAGCQDNVTVIAVFLARSFSTGSHTGKA